MCWYYYNKSGWIGLWWYNHDFGIIISGDRCVYCRNDRVYHLSPISVEFWDFLFFSSPVLGNRSALNTKQQKKKNKEYSTCDFNLATSNMHDMLWFIQNMDMNDYLELTSNKNLMESVVAICISDNDGSTLISSWLLDWEDPSTRIHFGYTTNSHARLCRLGKFVPPNGFIKPSKDAV